MIWNRQLRAALTVGLLLLLASLGWAAAPRVALVKVLSGTVHLDAQLVRAPVLAEEGQLLELAPGSEVVITPLGSRGTVRLKGPGKLSLTRDRLQSEADRTPQRALEVAQDLGNFSRGAAEVVRDSGSRRVEPVGLKVGTAREIGPGSGFLLPIEADPKMFDSGGQLAVELMELLPAAQPGQRLIRRFLTEEVLESPTSEVYLQSSKIAPERRYLLRMVYRADESEASTTVRERRWRLLTSDEKRFLEERDLQLRTAALDGDSVGSLVLLAQLYSDFDQLEETFDLLLEVHRSPEVQSDPELKETLEGELLDLAELLDRPFSTKSSSIPLISAIL